MGSSYTPPVNLASPGPIGGTTPAAVATTALTVTDGSLAIRGSISTTTGMSIGFAAQDWLSLNANGNRFFDCSGSSATFNIPVGANGLITGVSGVSFNPAVGGSVFQDFVDAASVNVDGTEDTLYTHSNAAGCLNANGAKLSGYFQLAIVGHAVSTDRIRIYFGGTAIFDTTALNFPLTSALTINFEIIRVSSSVVRASCTCSTSSATVIAYSQYVEVTGLTLSNAQVLVLKSISTGANSAAADVTAKAASVLWQPAA